MSVYASAHEEQKYALFQTIYEALQRLSRDHYLNISEARKVIHELESR